MLAIGVTQAFHGLAVGLSKATLAPIARVCGNYIAPLMVSLGFCVLSLLYFLKWKNLSPPSIADHETCESPRSQHLKVCCQGPPGKLTIDFWIIALMHLLIASSHRLFGHIDAAFLGIKFRQSPSGAGFLTSLTEVISVFLSPLLGLYLDRRRTIFTLPFLLLIGTIAGSVGYGMLAFATGGFSLEIGLTLVAIVNSISPTVLKSVVPETVHDSVLATGLGVYESMESAGVLTGSLLIGAAAARSGDDYSTCVPVFVVLLLIACCLSIALLVRRNNVEKDISSIYIDTGETKHFYT
jgi:hypothetical protein